MSLVSATLREWPTRRHLMRIFRCMAKCVLLNVERRRRIRLLHAIVPSEVDHNDRSARQCRRDEQIELKKCSTELRANEPLGMYSDQERPRHRTRALGKALRFRLGIITLSLQAGVLPARTRHTNRKCDDGVIFGGEGNKRNF